MYLAPPVAYTSTSKDLNERLAALGPTIEKIRKISGTAGVSLGVSYHGKIAHYDNFGYADFESKNVPNEETIYPACSLMKAVLSAAIGTIVEAGEIEWDTRVKDVLPDFDIKDKTIRETATIDDLLAHRTGMSISDYYLASDNNVLISKEDSIKFINDQKPVKPFRGQFQYNNLGYELSGHIIDTVTGKSWAKIVRERIFRQLGLSRTYTDPVPKEVPNVAKAYCTLDDGTPTPIHTVKSGENVFGGSSGGLRSCVKDLLVLYGVFIETANHQFRTGKTSTPGYPLKQMSHLFSAKTPLEPPTYRETSYALGWARVQLPGPMGAVGCNPPLMPDGMPIVGKGSFSPLVFYHQGSLPGALAAVILIPEIRSAVVVLTNSLALNDCADWIGQLVLEEVLDVATHERNDYVQAATDSAANTRKWFDSIQNKLREDCKRSVRPRPLESYVGTYFNFTRTVKIVVSLAKKNLYWAAQDWDSEKYILTHYENDTFTWLQPRNELARRGRWVDQGPEFWKIKFHSGGRQGIESLSWAHDEEIPNGEIFSKE